MWQGHFICVCMQKSLVHACAADIGQTVPLTACPLTNKTGTHEWQPSVDILHKMPGACGEPDTCG